MSYTPRVAGLAELYRRLLESDIIDSPWALRVSAAQALLVVHCANIRLFGHIDLNVLERSDLLATVVESFESWVKETYRHHHLREVVPVSRAVYAQKPVVQSKVRYFTMSGLNASG